jgi:hypothetical protein
MWRANKWHEAEVTIYNEETPTELEGAKAIRKNTDDETIRIHPLKEGTMFFWDDEGRFEGEGLRFQVSKKQLASLSFDINGGRTFIEYNGKTFRIVNVYDYTHLKQIRLMECKAVKILDVD